MTSKRWGGRRSGAGRPRKQIKKSSAPATQLAAATDDRVSTPVPVQPLDYMLKVMNDPKADSDLRAKMAVAAAPYVHPKMGEQGKKGSKDDTAKRLSSGGRFAAPAPPPRAADRAKH